MELALSASSLSFTDSGLIAMMTFVRQKRPISADRQHDDDVSFRRLTHSDYS